MCMKKQEKYLFYLVEVLNYKIEFIFFVENFLFFMWNFEFLVGHFNMIVQKNRNEGQTLIFFLNPRFSKNISA